MYANNNPATLSDPTGLIPDYCGVDVQCYGYNPNTGCPYGCGTKANQAWGQGQKAKKKQNDDAAYEAAGYSREDHARALELKRKSTFDVVIEAGGEILSEFLGINDIKGCFGDGDLGSCISMVINIIPWSKLFRLGELIGAVKKAWKAVTSFRGQQKWANNVTGAIDSARKKVAGCHSFRPDTEVRMADGSTKPISEIALGDKVLATDPETGRTEPREVVVLHTNTDYELVDIRVGGEDGPGTGTVHTTENHPFWSEREDAWVDAGELAPGDLLLASDGSQVTVAGVNRYTGEQLMHDLTVDDVHTYYVVVDGSRDVLVHNNNGSCVHSVPGVERDGPCPYCDSQPSVQPNTGSPGFGGVPEASRTHVSAEVPTAPQYINDGLQAGNGGDVVVGALLGAAVVAKGVKLGLQRLRPGGR